MNRQRVTYTPTGGVCSKMMIVDSEDNVIKNVQIIGGLPRKYTRFVQTAGRNGNRRGYPASGRH